MKYKANTRRRAAEYEPALVEWWKKSRAFEQSVESRPADNSYVFYDGPPFITGMPHHGTLLSSIVKDAVPRFWTMRGKRVERRWGWDCHGLPAENFVEKQLGITDRREIGTKWSLEEYILKARESMVANSETWEGTIDRIGRWVDFRGAYRTMDKDFMESVWWAFKTLYDKGKIYEGRKVLMYDTKFCTPVSKSEVTMDNDAYQTVTDPSAYVKFPLAQRGGEPTYFLAWTTTPWTLPANLALAVSPSLDYCYVKVAGQTGPAFDGKKDFEAPAVFILAKTRLQAVFGEQAYEIIDTKKGSELAGLEYAPLIPTIPRASRKKDTYHVLAADFVSDADGTGIVHIAPAYGEDDYSLTDKYDLDFIDVLDENGYYLPEVAEQLRRLGVRDTDEHGIEIWAANKFIAKVFEEQGIVWKIEYIKHEYPFNPRSKQRIIYRAFPSWFFDIAGSKPLMIEQNQPINWFPDYLKHGRFEKNIEQAPDWNLSRDRFWATAMPVWKSDQGTVKVFGSYEELARFTKCNEDDKGIYLDDYHRPWVDSITFDAFVLPSGEVKEFYSPDISPDDDVLYAYMSDDEEEIAAARRAGKITCEHFRRIDKVLDCWFESGSMPFAELHYPFENKEKFEANYPADFIVEYVGQVRAWFYYVHAVNTALFGKNAYKNVITTGTLAGNDGRKMSKSLGNYTDPNILMDKFSADALRFLLLSSPVLSGEDFALTDKDVSDTARKLTMVWNVYDFFTTYAEVDGFDSANALNPETPSSAAKKSDHAHGSISAVFTNDLDIWIISRLWQLRNSITEGMEEYNLPKALSGVLEFLDDLSNWFVRRSRRRFWKSEDDADKLEAYSTLYYVLTYFAKIIAPFAPFLAEELYQNMTGTGTSVHLCDWPAAGEPNSTVLEQMSATRAAIATGLALRMEKSETEEQIKVRQPLAKFIYAGEKLPAAYEQMIAEEVNVKHVEPGATAWLDKKLTEELEREGFARELVRAIQSARKKAGLVVDDRIKLSVSCEVPEEWLDMVKSETLTTDFSHDANYTYDEIVKVGGENLTISLEKA